LFAEVTHYGLRTEHPLRLTVENGVEIRFRHIQKSAPFLQTCVIDQDIDLAETPDSLLDELLAIGNLADIRLKCCARGALSQTVIRSTTSSAPAYLADSRSPHRASHARRSAMRGQSLGRRRLRRLLSPSADFATLLLTVLILWKGTLLNFRVLLNSSGDRDFRTQINVLNCIQQLNPFL